MPQTHKLEGFVYNHNSLPQADRVVRAYRRDYGTLIGEATTGNGNFVPADEYYNNVSLLLPFDGLHGETTTTDLSPTPKTVTFHGNAALSNVQKKYGGTSCNVEGGYLAFSANPEFNFGSSDFTWEAWIYRKAVNGATYADAIWCSQVSPVGFAIGINPDGKIGLAIDSPSGGDWDIRIGVDPGNPRGTVAIPLNTWTHIAVTRQGSTFIGWVNGVIDQTFSSNAVISDANSGYFLGHWHDGWTRFFNGYIDDLRITKGVARYSADFTPPAQPYPSTGYGGNALGKFTIPTNFTGETYVVVLPHETEVTNMKVKDRVLPVLA